MPRTRIFSLNLCVANEKRPQHQSRLLRPLPGLSIECVVEVEHV